MRRRSLAPKDSLDLLLDTMCNAFGGIVLMAILIALLIQDTNTDNPSTPSNQRETARIAQKERELAVLEEEVRALEGKVEANKELLDLVRQRKQLESTVAERRASGDLTVIQLNKRLGDLLAEKSEELTRLGRVSASLASVKAESNEKESALEKIQDQLEHFVSSRVSETRPPELRDSSGMQFSFIFRYGEIYPVANLEFGATGEILDASYNRVSITWQGSQSLPRQGYGAKLGTGSTEVADLLRKIKRHNELNADYPSKRFYIISFVYGDSFDLLDQFRTLIDEIGGIKNGWEPWPAGEPLGFSSEGRKSKTE